MAEIEVGTEESVQGAHLYHRQRDRRRPHADRRRRRQKGRTKNSEFRNAPTNPLRPRACRRQREPAARPRFPSLVPSQSSPTLPSPPTAPDRARRAFNR